MTLLAAALLGPLLCPAAPAGEPVLREYSFARPAIAPAADGQIALSGKGKLSVRSEFPIRGLRLGGQPGEARDGCVWIHPGGQLPEQIRLSSTKG